MTPSPAVAAPLVDIVAGARPNFMKIAPVHRALGDSGFELVLLHTGQHYDEAMSRLFFDELDVFGKVTRHGPIAIERGLRRPPPSRREEGAASRR